MEFDFSVPSEHSPRDPIYQLKISLNQQTPKSLLNKTTLSQTHNKSQESEEFQQSVVEIIPQENEELVSPNEVQLGEQMQYYVSDYRTPSGIYVRILLRQSTPHKLIKTFMKEPYGLISSDAQNCSFQIDDCLKRLQIGYDIWLIDYQKGIPQQVRFRVTKPSIFLTIKKKVLEIPFKSLSGLLLGAQSSTFSLYRNNIGELQQQGFEFHNCLTLINKCRTYDIATRSHRAKYDIYLYLTWAIQSQSRKASLIPLSKKQLTKQIVKTKINFMSKQKHLFFKELFLLAIYKTCVQMGKPSEKLEIVKNLLNRAMEAGQKVYRLCQRVKPPHYKSSISFMEKYSEQIRQVVMNSKRVMYLSKLDQQRERRRNQWNQLMENENQMMGLPRLKKMLNCRMRRTNKEFREDTMRKISPNLTVRAIS